MQRFDPNAPGPEVGVTIIELAVAMALFLVVIALLLPSYLVSNDSSSKTASMTTDDSSTVQALSVLSTQIQNATELSSPCSSFQNSNITTCQTTTASGGPGGSALLLYFETGNSLSGLTGLCSQWQLYNGQLQNRTWAPSSNSAEPFTTVAYGLNITSNTLTGQPPFALENSSGNGEYIVDIDFMVQPTSSRSPSQEIETSLAAQQVLSARGITAGQPTCTPPQT